MSSTLLANVMNTRFSPRINYLTVGFVGQQISSPDRWVTEIIVMELAASAQEHPGSFSRL